MGRAIRENTHLRLRQSTDGAKASGKQFTIEGMPSGGDIRRPEKGQGMSKGLAEMGWKILSLESWCSIVRQVELQVTKRELIVAINLLMQKRVGPSMMYIKSHFALTTMRTRYAAQQFVLDADSKEFTDGKNRGLKKISRRQAAFTLAEVVVCVAIVALVFGGIITSYIQGAYRAEWAGYNLAAQSMAMQQIEQAKTAVWDSSHNEFTNLVLQSWGILDLPINGTNKVYATNYVTVFNNVPISGDTNVWVQMVKVDTVWPYVRGGEVLYYTNTIADYYAMDQ
jgi:type II secretory pathway pseudopilin PulG